MKKIKPIYWIVLIIIGILLLNNQDGKKTSIIEFNTQAECEASRDNRLQSIFPMMSLYDSRSSFTEQQNNRQTLINSNYKCVGCIVQLTQDKVNCLNNLGKSFTSSDVGEFIFVYYDDKLCSEVQNEAEWKCLYSDGLGDCSVNEDTGKECLGECVKVTQTIFSCWEVNQPGTSLANVDQWAYYHDNDETCSEVEARNGDQYLCLYGKTPCTSSGCLGRDCTISGCKNYNTCNTQTKNCEFVGTCGDGTCNTNEDCGTCASDCKCGTGKICKEGNCVTKPSDGTTCGTNEKCPFANKCVGGKCEFDLMYIVYGFVAFIILVVAMKSLRKK